MTENEVQTTVGSNGKAAKRKLSFKSHQDPIPFDLDGKDYEVREFQSGGYAKYMKATANRMQVKRDRSRMVKFDDLHGDLICLCVWDVSTNQLVNRNVVDGWGPRTQNDIYELCMEINGLSKSDEEEEEKN